MYIIQITVTKTTRRDQIGHRTSLACCEHKSSQSGTAVWLKTLAYLYCADPEFNRDILIRAYTWIVIFPKIVSRQDRLCLVFFSGN